MKQFFTKLILDESGQDLIEYSLIAGVLGLGAVASMKTLATNINSLFASIGLTLTTSV